MKTGFKSERVRALTLIELLVVIAFVAILAAMLLPALSRTKAMSHSTECLNNLKQLQTGYLMYVDENNDRLPPNRSRLVALGSSESTAGSWVVGNTQLDTNTANIQAGVLFPFVLSPSIYHCPADKSTVLDRPSLKRTRSYGLDNWVNGGYTGNGYDWTPDSYPWSQVRLSTMQNPSPGGVFGFIDFQEQDIAGGLFVIEQPSWVVVDDTTDAWHSLAADRHQQGCNLSFLDGHVEHWHWKAPKIYKSGAPLARPGGDLADHRRLQECVPHDVVR